jgi:hypothetical protein
MGTGIPIVLMARTTEYQSYIINKHQKANRNRVAVERSEKL